MPARNAKRPADSKGGAPRRVGTPRRGVSRSSSTDASARRPYQRGGRGVRDRPRPSEGGHEVSLQNYATLYEYGPFGHLVLDRNGLIRRLNQTASQLLGMSREKLVGHPLMVMLTKPSRRRFFRHLHRLRRGQSHSTVELELIGSGARPVCVQMVSVACKTPRAHLLEYHSALLDITERKKAEARTDALARLGMALNLALDPKAAARAVADAAQELCGWDACYVALYNPAANTLSHLLNMDTIQGERRAVEPLLEGRPPTPMLAHVLREGPHLVLRRKAADESPDTLRFGDTSRASRSLMFVPIVQDGQASGVLSIQSYTREAYDEEDLKTLQALGAHVSGALLRLHAQAELRRANEELEARVAGRTAELQKFRDQLEVLVKQRTAALEAAVERLRQEITQRQAAELALRHTAAELKRSNAELEQFAYVASHDLQEPLRAVAGYVRLLQRRFPDKVDAKAQEYIQGACEGAVRMEQEILDLLTLSRVGGGGLRLAPIDLAEPLKQALQHLQFSVRTAKAKVTSDPMPTLPVDSVQVTQVFQNLVGNALKFRGENPPEVHVGAREEPGEWVFSVRDNGIGIDPQYFQRIFQVFQRLHTRKTHPGSGIGLTICKKVVEQHGGRIWVESRPGQGSTFYFTLPKPGAAEEEQKAQIQKAGLEGMLGVPAGAA